MVALLIERFLFTEKLTPKKWKNNGKGTGKSNGKGKFDPILPTSTPDGKQICFAYNNQHEGCPHGKACRREHVCRRCFGHIPLHMCDKNFRAPEATGA